MRGRPWFQLAAPVVVALVVIAAYSNSFHGGFVLDDRSSIIDNPTIASVWPIWKPLMPPSGTGVTVEGRPLLNLSLAFNYATTGLWLPGFHLTNLLIHLAASLLVLGICRRILKNDGVAFAMALLWAVHPLQTESVTYIIQRAESLMGLCYLATVYAFLRAVRMGELDPAASVTGGTRWLCVSLIACWLGMAAKEVMVSAPLIVLVLDRTLVAGSFREALRRHGRYYAGLMASWCLLGALVVHAGTRGNTSGMGVGVGFIQYWKTQPYAIAHYLYLFAYPRRLVLDYGTPWIVGFGAKMIVYYALVATLGVATIWGLIEGSIVGLLGFWFFAILAPTSLVPGNRQTLAEHRMYLALVPVVLSFGWMIRQFKPGRRALAVTAALLVCGAFAWLTHRRNQVYRSELAAYGDCAAKVPSNAFAQENYGAALSNVGRYWEAEPHFRRALALVPIYPTAEQALGVALIGMGRLEEAELHLKKAAAVSSIYGDSYANLGAIYIKEGRIDEAIAMLKAAALANPNLNDVHNNLGSAYASKGRLDLAMPEFEIAVREAPLKSTNRINFARSLAEAGKFEEAFKQYETVLSQDPENANAHLGYAAALERADRKQEAANEYAGVLKVSPVNPSARLEYGTILGSLNRTTEAVAQLRIAVQQMPGSAAAHTELALELGKSGPSEEAVNELNLALRLNPDYAPAQQALARAKASR